MSAISRRAWLLLALVTLFAFTLRLYRLDEIPPGLHHDEALNGLEAQNLLTSGQRPIYLGSGFNGEPLLEYSMMLSVAVFGATPFAVRLPSALYGALTIPIVFFAAHTLFRRGAGGLPAPHASRNALLAALILATLYWHLNASREGYKPVFLPLFGALTFWLLLESAEAARRRPTRLLLAALTGAALGLSAYTYPSIRFLYPVVVLYMAYEILRERARLRTHVLRAGVIALCALLVFAPLGLYYVQNPEAFFTRSNQVGVWVTHPNGVLGALVENSLKVAGMFFVRGDINPRQNLPARPAFDWILSVGFIVGLALTLWRVRRPANFLVLTWLVAMLVPSVVTEAAPNFLRTLGATVPAVLLVVIGFDWLLMQARALTARVLLMSPALWNALLLALVLVSSALSLDAYFNQLPRDPRAWYAFDVGLVKIADAVRALPPDEPLYLTPFTTEQATIQFELGAPRANFKWFDGRKCLLAPPPAQRAHMLVVSEDFRTLERLQEAWPQGRVTQRVDDFASKNYLRVFEVPAQPWALAPRMPRGDVFGAQAVLVGDTLLADRIEAGQGVPLILFWRAARPMSTAYTVFTQLLGPHNARTNTPLWGQNDHQPCAGSYPTTQWSAGEMVTEDFLIVVDKDAPAGHYQIAVGLYELATGARLKLPNGEDRVLLGPVEIFRK